MFPMLNVSVSSCSFVGNSASAGAGGALSVALAPKYKKGPFPSGWSTFDVVDTVLTGNSASASGGAIYVADAAVALTRVTCSGNAAAVGSGGCVAAALGTGEALNALSLTSCTLDGNSAVSGGALAASCTRQTSDATVQRCVA
jgi:predicted outer membrane repeat protein